MRRGWIKQAAVGGALVLLGIWTARDAWSARRLPVAPALIVNRAYRERADTLRRDETLSHLFARQEIVGVELIALLDAADGLDPRRVPAGQIFEFRYPVGDPRPDRVTVRLSDERLLTLGRDEPWGWVGETFDIPWAVHAERVNGKISSSLYVTLDELIPDSILPPAERARLLWDLADGVFGWVVDFTRDTYPGDEVHLLYERLTSSLGDVRFGRVLAAKLGTRGVANSAYVLTGPDGRNNYYDDSGRSLRRAFKLYPVSFKYISSGFSRSRYHPILKTRRPHLGVDYRASTGAPISATGDGVVIRVGRWGGYGNVVAVRHPKGIETRYAHMKSIARGIVPGLRVRQGQFIGTVGMTGLATAPHVHYEFIQNGRQVDPRSAVRFGSGEPVPKSRRAEFEAVRVSFDRLFLPRSDQPTATGVD